MQAGKPLPIAWQGLNLRYEVHKQQRQRTFKERIYRRGFKARRN